MAASMDNKSLLLALHFLAPLDLSALSLDEAKTKGLVGETVAGYLAPVGPASAEVAELVRDVNSKRKQKYFEIAQRNGTAMSAVEALAGKKAIAETGKDRYVEERPGAWKKK
jgi:uncharacterized protein YdbL (DUF1318 family)